MDKTYNNDVFSRLNKNPANNMHGIIPPLVISRAKSAGTVGEAWLANLDNMISELEEKWSIFVGEAISGGTHAFVANADGRNGEKYVLKIDMPENLGGNTLEELSGKGFKLIDPDGIIYEKAYDLGVLMREWVDEYSKDPLREGKKRCRYLHCLTGVSQQAIWEWGYLQTISTAFVLLQIGQEETGRKMLKTAECWAYERIEAVNVKEMDYVEELEDFLLSGYGLLAYDMKPAARGFYGETWKVQTDNGEYFVKIDYWNYHKESYRRSLSVAQYMTENGISFIPKVVKTNDGYLHSVFQQGITAVFEYVKGQLSDCPVSQLYEHLAEIYQLKTDGIKLDTENFGIEQIDAYKNLRNMPDLSEEVIKMLDRKEPIISRYSKRLKHFSNVCKENRKNFHITHGDAGGNCILNGKQLFIVDWDTVMLAPIERDAWIFISEKQQLDKINSILAEKGIDSSLDQKRLCYYSYYFFFYYLNEFLKSIQSTKNIKQKEAISKNLIEYLSDSWIDKRLNAADRLSLE